MPSVPTAAAVRERLAPLDDLDKKVLGGLLATWMAAPQRVRDREWVSEQFVHLANAAIGAGDDGPATSADVERVRSFARDRMPAIEAAALLVFVRVAADLQARGGAFTFAAAQELVRGYLS
ncbi:MAG: hypothetical protein JNN13_15235 [Planctomycetes bacterium]|nr:hypothetical protein [Planctomycetota bacterium]